MRKQLSLILIATWAALSGRAWSEQLADAGNAFRAGDYPKALAIYQSLAAKGDPRAEDSLGTMYLIGKGVAKNAPEAIRWFSAAAKGGNIHAKTSLAVIYYQGTGAPQDLRRAFQLASSAASANDPSGQYLLGLMYEGGKGVPADAKLAYVWFSLAADKGLPLAIRDRNVVAEHLDAAGLNEARQVAHACKASGYKHCE